MNYILCVYVYIYIYVFEKLFIQVHLFNKCIPNILHEVECAIVTTNCSLDSALAEIGKLSFQLLAPADILPVTDKV